MIVVKVLFISNCYPTKNNPTVGVYVKELATFLSNFCDVTIISTKTWVPKLFFFKEQHYLFSEIPRIELIKTMLENKLIKVFYPRCIHIPLCIPLSLFFNLLSEFFSFFIFILLYGIEFDIIHGHHIFPEGFYSVILGRIYKKKVMVTCHNPNIDQLSKNPLLRRILKFIIDNSIIIYLNEHQKEVLLNISSSARLIFIPNGVDLTKFKIRGAIDCRKKIGCPLNAKIILCLASLTNRKGIPYLINAFKLIYKPESNLYLYLIGGGKDHKSILRLVKRLDLERNILLLGAIQHDLVPLWMSACDVFVLPSLAEGWPTVFFEAIASGKPVIMSKLSWNKSIRTKYGCIWVKPRSSRELAIAIKKALNIKWDVDRIANFSKKNSWFDIAKKYYLIYNY